MIAGWFKRRYRCHKEGHEWGDWCWYYPTQRSVWQKRHCERCGAVEKNKIVGHTERDVTRAERRRREKTND